MKVKQLNEHLTQKLREIGVHGDELEILQEPRRITARAMESKYNNYGYNMELAQ